MSRRYRDLAAWRLGRPLQPWETKAAHDRRRVERLLRYAHAVLPKVEFRTA